MKEHKVGGKSGGGEASTEQAGVKAPGGLMFGYPKGLFLVAGTELWERFSFYGMLGLLVLFLTDPVMNDGFGWSEADALRLYGIYIALVYITPTFGGWLASTKLGEQRCVLWGGILVTLGHFCLGGPAYLPFLFEKISGVPVHDVIASAGLPRGLLFVNEAMQADLQSAVDRLTGSEVGAQVVQVAYVCTSLSFWAGLSFIIFGTAFIKPTVTSLVGKFYEKDDRQRDAAFTIFLAAVYVGAFAANFVAGTMGEKLGWHYGLSAAGAGMFFGVLFFILLRRRYLGDVGKYAGNRKPTKAGAERVKLTASERSKLNVIVVGSFFSIVYAFAFYQKGGLLHLITNAQTDRVVIGFEVPATWFLTISTGFFIALAPLFARLWIRLEKTGRSPDVCQKLAIGLALLAIGYVFQLGAAYERDLAVDGKSSILWVVATYICFGLGDIFFWPTMFAAVSRFSPERLVPFVFGAWYSVFGIGTWLAGEFGALAYDVGQKAVFWGILLACCFSAAALILLRPSIKRASRGQPMLSRAEAG